MISLRPLAVPLVVLAMWGVHPAGAKPVTLEIRLKLTDLENRPLAGVPVRLVVASQRGWQNAAAGRRVVTDGDGQASFSSSVELQKVRKKRPGSFVAGLLGGAEDADRLSVGAELEWGGFHWLHVLHLHRFGDGDVVEDGFEIYSRDGDGHFTIRAGHDDEGWRMPELNGLVLTSPGFAPSNFDLRPLDGSAGRWRLDLGFRKSPPPVRR